MLDAFRCHRGMLRLTSIVSMRDTDESEGSHAPSLATMLSIVSCQLSSLASCVTPLCLIMILIILSP
jgi:hypothetical protein